ncbi:hypothetical protein [Stieleria maiorica]|uniref:hypothetical protein n=1 Tax=Stieleria maiorica TaxID=2795974 RepID=UPI0011C74BC6|nr:hypothetical protein [Stieleria maiorica]
MTVATSGEFALANNAGTSGEDIFSVDGTIAAGLLGPTITRYTFAFVKPTNTVGSDDLNPLTLSKMIAGPTSMNFKSGPLRAMGVIRGAPEPNTMIALSGLVIGGCGIGYRRRQRSKAKATTEAEK